MPRRTPNPNRGGFTLVEVSMSVFTITVLFLGAISMTGQAKATRYRLKTQDNAQFLCSAMLTEITTLPYEDPDTPTASLGPDAGEVIGNQRNLFDDVDDFDGWVASPPSDVDGNAIAGAAGWERRVTVVWLDPSDLGQESSVETGIKRITVTVTRAGRFSTEVSAVRTNAR